MKSKWNFLGIVMVIAVMATGCDGLISKLKNPTLARNDKLAKSTLKKCAEAAESFFKQAGRYPQNMSEIAGGRTPFLNPMYNMCEQRAEGYNYKCEFVQLEMDPAKAPPDQGVGGYRFLAIPVVLGETGTEVYSIETGLRQNVKF